ncbi:hypothetical protein ABKV19_008852 [Rosa sericea]
MGCFHFHQIFLALVASAAGAYLHLLWNIPSYIILLAFEGVALAVCGYLAAADFFSKPRSEFVIEKLYRYGLWFMVMAMVGCFTEDTFTFGKRMLLGGSLPHPTPVYDIVAITYLLRAVKWNDSRLENILKKKKMAAAEKLGGCTSARST